MKFQQAKQKNKVLNSSGEDGTSTNWRKAWLYAIEVVVFSIFLLIASKCVDLSNHSSFYISPALTKVLGSSFSHKILSSSAVPEIVSQEPPAVEALCPYPSYQVRILSYSPLLIYIENFVSTEEREKLLALAEDQYAQSEVDGAHPEYRTSTSAFLENQTPVVSCVRDRAAHFQGLNSTAGMEQLQVVRYKKNQQYKRHYDWYPEVIQRTSASDPFDRWTSFFVILDANQTVGGSTLFPNIKGLEERDRHEQYCKVVECHRRNGLAVRPVAGNAVFWTNRLRTGKGDTRSLHEGMEVLGGSKTGMNIWTEAHARHDEKDEMVSDPMAE